MPDSPQGRPLLGIALKLGSVVVFIVMAAIIKATAPDIPPGQVVFARSFFAIPVIVAWLVLRGEWRTGWRVASPMGHVWRGLVGTTAMGLGFAGLGLLPLPEATAIGYAAPLLTVVFAAMFLGEEVRAFRMGCVALGLAGVLIVVSPRLTLAPDAIGQAETLGAVLLLAGAVFAALAQVFIRKLVATEGTAAIVLWFSVSSSVLALVTLPWGWAWPTPRLWALLVATGLLGGVGQILLTAAYRQADASLVAPFDYASMLFALAIGYAVFAEVPTATMLAGAAIVILAGILIIWRERQLGLKRARQRKATTP